jgi:hypothetical protein
MSFTELYIIFGLGLVSSLHCVQMCGPVVLSYSINFSRTSANQQLIAHLSYNTGRIITYGALGAVAGLTGQTIGFAGNLAGIENIAAIVAGGLMIIAALLMLDLLPHKNLPKFLRGFDPLRYVSRSLKPFGSQFASTSIRSKFTLGLMLGFLPCGLIYAALLKAMATGTAFAGALTMMAFGLGTAGSLILIGMFSSALSFRLGLWGSRLAAISIALLGAVLVWRGIMPIIPAGNSQAVQCHHRDETRSNQSR